MENADTARSFEIDLVKQISACLSPAFRLQFKMLRQFIFEAYKLLAGEKGNPVAHVEFGREVFADSQRRPRYVVAAGLDINDIQPQLLLKLRLKRKRCVVPYLRPQRVIRDK
jgi:hypothetical protein